MEKNDDPVDPQESSERETARSGPSAKEPDVYEESQVSQEGNTKTSDKDGDGKSC